MYFVSTIVSRFLRDVKSNRNRSLDAARYRSTPPAGLRAIISSSARRLFSVSGAACRRIIVPSGRIVNLAS